MTSLLDPLFRTGALGQVVQMIEGLEIDTARMRHNLDATQGLMLAEAVSTALAPQLGREAAHGLIEEACSRAIEQNKPLRDVLAKDARVGKLLTATDLDRLLDPENYLGVAEQFVERVLATRTGRKKQT